MDRQPTLSPENARLLEEAANTAESLERRCLTGMHFANNRDDAARDIVGTVDDGIEDCRQTIAGILSQPDLLPWMDGNDRYDLGSLSREFSINLSERADALIDSNTPNAALCRFFCNTRSTARMAALLIRATRRSLRHRLCTQPIYEPSTYQKDAIHIRWMIPRDMPAVLAMDEESFEAPWLEEEFLENRKARQCVGMVAERDDRVMGSMVYELHDELILAMRFAVEPKERRKGIGSALVRKLYDKLHATRRRRLLLPLPDSSFLSNPCFFANQQLQAVAAVPHSDEDGHLLEHCIDRMPAILLPRENTAHGLSSLTNPACDRFAVERNSNNDDDRPWTPDDLTKNDPYGLWGDGEET